MKHAMTDFIQEQRHHRYLLAIMIILIILLASIFAQPWEQLTDAVFTKQREEMVKFQLLAPGRGIRDEAVLRVMGRVPRHEFVPNDVRAEAYSDRPLPIGHRQTTSQPYIVAFMTEQLQPRSGDRVLEIGTGSGYQAAVLSGLVKEVYTIEIIEALGKQAEKTLKRLGYKNVKVRVGDGYQGWPDAAPFDAIVVTSAPDKVPDRLVEQLKEGGRMVIPVGDGLNQSLYLLEKKQGKVEQQAMLPVRFVPMIGGAGEGKKIE